MKNLNLEIKEFNSKGITLVALVVTIVILLILAGITIASLTGENGLIGKSGEAKKQAEISEGLEQLEIAVTQSTNKRGNIDEKKLAKNLSKISGLKYINDEKQEVNITENTDIKFTAKVKLKGNTFKINDEGNVSYKKDDAIDSEDVMESPSTYYGKYVTNYTTLSDTGINAQEGQKWQIFMADDTNIYLIASNAINKQYAPTAIDYNYDTNKEKTAAYQMWFTNILSQYNTNIAGNPSVATILGKLSKQDQYHEWLRKATLQNYDNQKAVLSMLDTDKWNEYNDSENNKRGLKNSTYASYVIGGPTVEMFCESYNVTHGGLDVIPRPKDDNNAYYQYGYKVQKGEILDNSTGDLKASTQTTENEDINNMYFKCHYRLASPSANNTGIVMFVNSSGSVNATGYTAKNICFRPLVCLKSNVHLVEKTNGNTKTYELELD